MGTAEVRAGGAYVEAYMKDAGLKEGIKKVTQSLQSIGKTVATVGVSLAGIGAAIRVPLQAAAHVFADTASELVKLSKEVGLSAETLSELKYAAEQSNISLEKAIEQVKSGVNDFAALRQEARNLGVVLSGADAAAGNELRQSMSSLKAVLNSITTQIGAAVAPAIKETTLLMRKWSAVVVQWVKNHRPMFLMLTKIGGALVIAGTALTTFGGAISAVGAGLGILTSAISAILSPLGLIAIAIGAGTFAFFKYTEAGKATLQWFAQQLPQLKAITVGTFKGIHDALAAGDLLLAGKTLWAGLKTLWYQGLADLNKVWMGTYRIMGGIAIRTAFDAANALSGALVIVQEKWVGFSAFIVNALDTAWVAITAKAIRAFAYLMSDLEFIWQNKWDLLKGITASVLDTIGSTIKKVLGAAFLWVAETAIEALTMAIRAPLEALQQIPGMAALAGKGLAILARKSGELRDWAVSRTTNVEKEKPEDSIVFKAIKAAGDLERGLEERQAGREFEQDQGIRGANVAG